MPPLSDHDDLVLPPITSDVTSIYFTSLEEARSWYESRHKLPLNDKLRISREKLKAYHRSDAMTDKGKLQLQIVHDFKNGYQEGEDKNPTGYFPSLATNYYRLQFPTLCDEFVYFTHHRISVPPISWVNQCHKNGICCLGTIIFEGNTLSDYSELDRLLTKEEDGIHFKYVTVLVELASHYNFEGYLINIETRFTKAEYGMELVSFITSLRAELKLINEKSRLVWYDAYTAAANRVRYGNGITDDNYEFMRSADSMLTNYWWTERHLQRNIELAGLKENLFVGVDVWGRGMKYGNGGFESVIAVQKITAYRNNAGIFAPGWTYEYLGADEFEKNDARFWLEPKGNSISDIIGLHNSTVYNPCDRDFIFYTNFSDGKGLKFFEKGELLMNDNWINGSLTSEIPALCRAQQASPPSEEDLMFTLYYKDAYHLGSSLKIDKLIERQEELSVSNYLNKRQQNNRVTKKLFLFDQEFHTDLNLKLSYKYLSSTATHFHLVLQYYVVRAVKTIHKVRDGQLSTPIYNNGGKWVLLDESFKPPQHSRVEKVFLQSIAIEFIELPDEDEGGDVSGDVSGASLKLDDVIDDEWVIVEQNQKRPGLKTVSLLMGDLTISSVTPAKTRAVTQVQRHPIPGDKVMLEWDTTSDPLYWNVIANDKFLTTSVVSYLILDDLPQRLRIDIVNRDGECIIGDDIMMV